MGKAKEKKRNAPTGTGDGAPTGTGDGAQIDKSKRRKLASEVTELKGLEIYWKLPSMDASERQAAVLALVREMLDAQRSFESKDGKPDNPAGNILLGEEHIDKSLSSCSPELQYALPRLVRGVGSSNQCARQGFASALTTILSKLPSVSSDSVLKLIDKEIEISSSLKGQELRDGLLGRLFAYASIIRAGRLIGDGSTKEKQELAKTVAEKLLSLAMKRSFLREPAISVFLELVDQLAVKSLQESVFLMPNFVEWLTATPEAGGAVVLLLALKLWDKLPDAVRSKCPLLPPSGSFKDLFQASHLDVLIPYLKESSSSHPRVHLVWDVLADGFKDQSLHHSPKKKTKRKNEPASDAVMEHLLLNFWSRVVDEALLDSSHERKFLVMQLVLLFLSKVPTSCISIILSVSFGRCLLDILASPTNLLYCSAEQFLSDLCEWAEQNQDRLVFTIAFFQQSSFGKFDNITKSSVVKDLMSKVTSEDSCLLAIQKLQHSFVSDVSDAVDDSDDAKRLLANRKIWMVELMYSFCKQASLISSSKSVAKEVTRFFAAHILQENEVLNSKKVNALVTCAPGPLPKAVKDACTAKLRALLSEKTCHRKHEQEENEDLGHDLVEFFQRALKKKAAEETQLKLLDIIGQMTSAMKTADNPGRLGAMRSLLSQLLIQLWLERDSVDDIATDLLICCKKEFGSVLRISVGDDVNDAEAPSVADVLLDVILSIVSGSPAPIRTAAEQVFVLYCSDISRTGLSGMLKVISKQIGQNRQESLFDIQDDGEDVLSVEDVAADEDSEDSGDSDEEEDGEDEKTEEKPEENRIQGAMDDDADLSDMDDEEMFKMDVHLAQILKERKGGDTYTQLLQFKFRVLGLVETYLQKQSESAAVLTTLPTLFQAYLDGNRQLADRIASVLSKVLKAKNYPKGPDVDIALVKDLLLKLLKLASKTTDDRVRVLAQGFVLWLLKVSQATGGSANEEVVNAISSAVDDIFSRRKTTLPLSFFHEGAVRYHWLGKIVIGKLVDKCKSGRTDYEKAETMELLASLLKLYKKSAGKSPEDVSSFVRPHLSSLSDVLILYFNKPLKNARQVSFLRFCIACLEALQALFPEQPLHRIIDTGKLSAAVAEFECPDKSKLKTFKAQLEALLKQCSDAAAAENKKRRK